MSSYASDPNGICLTCNPGIANVDIIISCRQVLPGSQTQGNVVAAGGVIEECLKTNGRIATADSVVIKCRKTDGRVVATGRVAGQ